MSIVESLIRLFDPVAHRNEDRKKQAAREAAIRDNDGNPLPFELPRAATKKKRLEGSYRCRVCDHVASAGEYCPVCLADTMIVL